MSTQLYLSYDEHLDWLTLIEFGAVENAQPENHWRDVNDSFAYILRRPGGPEIGFKMRGFSSFDPEDPEVSEIWDGPRFHVPVLGLKDSTAGEIVLAARPFLGGSSTINRVYFNHAMNAEGEEAERLWRYCLQAGDLMAHYALGYTLYELGRYREAYRHLRAYTELVPADGWAWAWLGKATEAMGDAEEARSMYERAIELGGSETDAPELLAELLANPHDMVEVQVGSWAGPLEDPGGFTGGRVRFVGRLVHEMNTGYEILRLYRCPEGFRVHLNDDLQGSKDGGYDLYPRSGGSEPDEPFGYYTAEALWEEWPELASAARIERPG